jgi:hypothetical protein
MTKQAKQAWWIGGILGALAIVLVVWQLYTFPERTNETQQSAVVVSSSPPGLKTLHVRVWVSDSVVAPGSSVQMSVRFENGTGQELKGLRIETTEPGFVPQPVTPASTVLAKGATDLPTVELKPTLDHGKSRVTVRYWVTDADGEHEGAVTTPPIVVRDAEAEKRYLVYRRVMALFKDLTLPLVLAGLGLWFQISQSRRDEKLKTRDAAEARRQEIWKTILPQFYSLSEEHYLPIVRSLRAIKTYRLATPATATTDQMNRLLFEFLFLLLRMDVLRRKRGQIFFKSRKGEGVVMLAWKILRLGSEDALERTNIDAALGKMTVDITYQQFLFQLATSSGLIAIRAKFVAWNMNPDATRNFYTHTHLAEIMQWTMYFEANRPFDRDWYEVATDFKLKAAADYVYPAGPICDADVAELKETMTAYREEVRSYLESLEIPNA